MPIQIIAQRAVVEGQKPVFVYLRGTSNDNLIPNITTLFIKLDEIIAHIPEHERENLYFTLAHHSGTTGATKPVRTKASFEYQTVIAFDIDSADTTRWQEYGAAVCRVLDVDFDLSTIVNSGNGIHVYFNLQDPIRDVKFFTEAKAAYKEICNKINLELSKNGLSGLADTSIFDPARVLRLPNTWNKKPSKEPKMAALMKHTRAAIVLDLYQISGIRALSEENVSPADIKRNWPKPDLPEMIKECRFMSWALTHPNQVHEPDAFDFMSLLACQPEDNTATFMAKEMTPSQLARYVYDNATSSQSLERQDFDYKWEQAGKYGGRKCQTIHDRWGGGDDGCKGCPHYGKLLTPLALRSREHIASEPTGYWVLSAQGEHKHPHYGDLARVFRQEHPFISTGSERTFVFKDTHYIEWSGREIKAWLEKIMSPTDPLKSGHRSEFLDKIRSTNLCSSEHEEQLFERTIEGKINCKNGVLDIMKGQLLPHGPEYGFKYVLPYDYSPNVYSSFFMDWLGTMTKDRTELMESILDVMAYCLWPNYDDHMFAFFTGEGSNGKSTLLDIMLAMVGSENVSSISIQQLGANRFAPASLDGKLINLSEESSGYEMGLEEMNTIKNLSSGGTMFVERKGEQGFLFTNRAKLLFSANKPPRFQENGHALKRRLIVIPFDHKITNPDPKIKVRLMTEEIPGIISILIKRIQRNVSENNGVFRVSRGGAVMQEAQRSLLTHGNTVIEWASEVIEVDNREESYVVTDEAYAHYLQWTTKNGYKMSANKNSFSKTIQDFILPPESIGVRKVGGRVTRVYTKAKFKEEVMR